MSEYERRISLALGVVLFGLLVAMAVLGDVDPAALSLAEGVGAAAIATGAVAFLLAGLRERVVVAGRTLEWWQFHAVGFVALGVYMAASGVADGSVSRLDALNVVAGLAFAATGGFRLRSGPQTTDREPSMREVAVTVVGTMVVVLLVTIAMLWFPA
ncbi:hypothetical protein [Halopiger goleimassiliensis]|uniref:hypothetical protein n=1 Tax=Halopiger goleimassiliensis TaxID=1293048 RepID=UPI000677AA32|nr:hypothetical protein [Halopiger goleimassiliensis]